MKGFVNLLALLMVGGTAWGDSLSRTWNVKDSAAATAWLNGIDHPETPAVLGLEASAEFSLVQLTTANFEDLREGFDFGNPRDRYTRESFAESILPLAPEEVLINVSAGASQGVAIPEPSVTGLLLFVIPLSRRLRRSTS